MNNRRKIRYIPGMISLIALPLLSIYYFITVGAFDRLRMIEITMPEGAYESNEISNFKKTHRFDEFKLSNDDNSNKTKISEIDSLLKFNKETNEMVNGIRVKFENQVKYEYLIKVLNLFLLNNYEFFLFEENEIWVVWNTPIIRPRNVDYL